MACREIARGPLWTGRLLLPREQNPADIQAVVNDLVGRTRDTIVGYHDSAASTFTMLRWPDQRPDYRPAPSDDTCAALLACLADRLAATEQETGGLVSAGRLHVLLGRVMDGYGDGQLAPWSAFAANAPGYTTRAVRLISARIRRNHGVEPYGEPAVIVECPAAAVALVHAAAERARQHHYAIEYGEPERVVLYETDWATRPPVVH